MTTEKKGAEPKDAEIVPTPKKPATPTKKNQAPAVIVGEITAYERQLNSVETMISKAIDKELDVATMKEILAMRKDLKAEWAREQFVRAMADCQAEMPIIEKSTQARDESEGKDLYKYASLDAIVKVASPIIAKHGFSYSFKTYNEVDKVRVVCIVQHRDGHSEESDMETALSTKTRIMSLPQQTAATVSFNKRYAFTNAFGITTGGEDNENALIETPEETSTPKLGTLRAMIKDASLTEAGVAEKFKVEKLEDLDKRQLKMLEKSLLLKLPADYIPAILE